MCELTLEALGYRAPEARIARRIHDLTRTPDQRANALRGILCCAPEPPTPQPCNVAEDTRT